MSNEYNLIPIRTKDEARELGQRGGIASGIARREKKKLRDTMLSMVNTPMIFDNDYSRKRFIEKYNTANPTIMEAILAQLLSSALSGDMTAMKLFLSFAAEPPPQIQFPARQITKQKIKVSYEAQQQKIE